MEVFTAGLMALTWKQMVMMIVGALLIYLAIAKEYEPTLLLPIGFGALMVNIPLFGKRPGHLFKARILTELFRCSSLSASGDVDFHLFKNPKLLLFGAAAQFGIFFTPCLWPPLRQPQRPRLSGSSAPPAPSIYVAQVRPQPSQAHLRNTAPT